MRLEVGKPYFFRNPAADSYVGTLVEIIDPFTVALDDASWIAYTGGRLHEFIRDGRCMGGPNGDGRMEVEYCGRVVTRYQSAIEWVHPVFKESY